MTSADSILQELGVTRAEDIDLDAIAFYCGAEVRRRVLEGCEARLVGLGSKAYISVNVSSPAERQRFSVAHELAHWMNDRGIVLLHCSRDDMNPRKSNEREARANSFAADLLMPKKLFARRIGSKPITIETVTALAAEFRTSLTSTCIRAIEVCGRPACLVVTDRGSRKWYRMDPDVPRALAPRRDIGLEWTKIAQCLSTGAEALTRTVSADIWIDRENSHEYSISESSMMLVDDQILTLLWWEDEQQVLDILDEE